MRALVTGGAGFIGSHVVDRLIAEGHEVDVWDDLSTGRREHVHPRATVFENPIGRLLPRMRRWDWIFHLAGRADLVASIKAPTAYLATNVMATITMLEHARRDGCQRFVYAGSSSCYGAAPPVPVKETDPVDPAHPYALSKAMGEEAVLAWGRMYGVPTTSLRLFNVYGPRVRATGAYGAVLPVFLAQRAHKQPLTIVGDGQQERDFVWVEDVAEAFLRAAMAPSTGVFNIGSGIGTSVLDLAKRVGGAVVHLPSRGGEPAVIRADVSRAVDVLGWRASTPVADGIERMLEHLDAWKTATLWTPERIERTTATWHRYLG